MDWFLALIIVVGGPVFLWGVFDTLRDILGERRAIAGVVGLALTFPYWGTALALGGVTYLLIKLS